MSEFTDEPEQRLVLGPALPVLRNFPIPMRVASASGSIRLVRNKNLTVLLAIATEPPAITVRTLIYLALVRHMNSGVATGQKVRLKAVSFPFLV
jgi:hypothetical protein